MIIMKQEIIYNNNDMVLIFNLSFLYFKNYLFSCFYIQSLYDAINESDHM